MYIYTQTYMYYRFSWVGHFCDFSDIFTVLFPFSLLLHLPLSCSLNRVPTFPISLIRTLVSYRSPLSFSSTLTTVPFAFLVSVVTPGNILIPENFELRASIKREHVTFVFPGLGHLIRCPLQQMRVPFPHTSSHISCLLFC